MPNKKLGNVNDLYRTHNARGMYELILQERADQPRLINIKDEQGKILTEEREIKNR